MGSVLLWLTAAVASALMPAGGRPVESAAAQDVLAQSRAAYAALTSYVDTGTLVHEFGSATDPSREQHTFRTSFRKPRHFLFDFLKGGRPDGERVVVWSDDEAFHSWWSATGVEGNYPRGQGTTAFVATTPQTLGSSVLIAPLLFQGAGLVGTLEELGDVEVNGTETVGGRTCHRLVGVARSRYATGREVNVRRTTVWIDTESLLVRKVFEDTPRGTSPVLVSRRTMTFVPQANPTLDDSRFRFVPPAPK